MTMNFIPEIDDEYRYATRVGHDSYMWEGDSIDLGIARSTGIFPYTVEGRKLAALQHAVLRETPKFWGWVDDYEFHT